MEKAKLNSCYSDRSEKPLLQNDAQLSNPSASLKMSGAIFLSKKVLNG